MVVQTNAWDYEKHSKVAEILKYWQKIPCDKRYPPTYELQDKCFWSLI